ncbi:MAG: MATE family efflux transporter [Bacilli bacterium]|jgi:putative MATE family efflux protein
MKILGFDRKFIKEFFKVAAPAMLQQLIIFGGLLLNTLMISGINNEAVSAVYAANQVSFLFALPFNGIVFAAGIYIQQFFGSKDKERLLDSFRYKLVTVGLGFLLMVLLTVFLHKHLIAFYVRAETKPEEITALALEYLPYIIASFAPYVFTTAYSTSMREIGKTTQPTIASIIAFLCQGIGNYIFIYVMGLGVQGAGLATLIARLIELIIIVVLSEKYQLFPIKDILGKFSIDRQLFKTISLKGIPLLFNEILWGLGSVVLSLSFAARPNVLSALSIVYTMSNLYMILFVTISVGASVFIGNYLGAGEVETAKENAEKLTNFSLFLGIILGGIVVILSKWIPDLFVEVDLEQKKLATKLLIIYFAFVPVFVICTANAMILRAGGKALLVFLLEEGLMWLLAIPLVFLLAKYTAVSIVWLYIIVQIVDFLKAVFGMILRRKVNWAQNLTVEYQQEKIV